MHRSGTSLVAGMMHLLGVELGTADGMMPATRDNPKGYWEQSELTQLNDALLDALGGSWDELPPLPNGWQNQPHLETLRESAKALLATRFSEADQWAWKDPRNSVTLPFWQKLVPGLRYVICIRNPIDAAESLRTREGEEVPLSHHIGNWLLYTAHALEQTSGRPRLILHYEDLLGDDGESLRRLAEFTGCAEELRKRPVKNRLDEFRDSSLAHSQSGMLAAVEDPQVPQQAAALYSGLRLLAPGAGGEEATGEQWRALDRLARRLREGYESERERGARLASLESHSLSQEQELNQERARVAELGPLVEEQRKQIEDQIAYIASRDSRIEDLQRLGDATRGLAAEQRGRIREQQALIREQAKRLEERDLRSEEAEARIRDAELRLSAQDQVAEAQSWELRARDEQLASVRREIASIEASASWKLTRPLRGLKRALRRKPGA
jgi:hypothetical protein